MLHLLSWVPLFNLFCHFMKFFHFFVQKYHLKYLKTLSNTLIFIVLIVYHILFAVNDLIERFGDSKLPDNHPSKIRLSDLRAQIEIVKSLKRAKPKPKPKPKKDEPESSGASNSSSSNSVNLEEFIHPTWKLNRGKVKKKLADSKPYRLFFSAIKDSPETHSEPLSISFQGLYRFSFAVLFTLMNKSRSKGNTSFQCDTKRYPCCIWN